MEAASQRLLLYREEKAIPMAVAVVKGNLKTLAVHIEKLHPKEKVHYQALKYDRRKTSYLLGRLSAKEALSCLRGVAKVSSICIDAGVFHFPVVQCPKTPNSQVSISHCDIIGASIAFEEAHPMGIDLEKVQDKYKEVMLSQMTEREQLLLKNIQLNNAQGYAVLWSVKESLSKVLKTGMMIDFSLLEVDSIALKGEAYTSTFTHFGQYKAISYSCGAYVVSITCPKKSLGNFCQVWQLFDTLHIDKNGN
ncbi:MAG: 4'-phosphopantetheinyl transferase superfamily protein [Bacteroidota bacterium]